MLGWGRGKRAVTLQWHWSSEKKYVSTGNRRKTRSDLTLLQPLGGEQKHIWCMSHKFWPEWEVFLTSSTTGLPCSWIHGISYTKQFDQIHLLKTGVVQWGHDPRVIQVWCSGTPGDHQVKGFDKHLSYCFFCRIDSREEIVVLQHVEKLIKLCKLEFCMATIDISENWNCKCCKFKVSWSLGHSTHFVEWQDRSPL